MLEIRAAGHRCLRRRCRRCPSVDLDVPDGEVLALLGPSGCGKSTLLRAIAGLEPLAAGRIRWDGTDLAGIPVHRRGFGLMFQDGVLFPHRDVAGNIAYGLQRAGLRPAQIDCPGRRSAGTRRTAGLRLPAGRDPFRRRGAAGRAGPGACAHAHGCCCWTNRWPHWTGRCASGCWPTCGSVLTAHRDDRGFRHPRPGRGLRGRRPARRDASGSIRQVGPAAEIWAQPGRCLGRRVRRVLARCWTRRPPPRSGRPIRSARAQLGLRPAALVLDRGRSAGRPGDAGDAGTGRSAADRADRRRRRGQAIAAADVPVAAATSCDCARSGRQRPSCPVAMRPGQRTARQGDAVVPLLTFRP